MKVLFLNPSAQLGGAERSLLEIVSSIRESKPEWRMALVLTAEGPLVQRARALGVETTVLPLPEVLSRLGDGGASRGRRLERLWSLARAIPAAVFYVIRLRRLIRRLRPDVLHSNGFKMHVLSAWARPARVPLVWHVHDFVSRRPVMSVLLGRNAGACAVMIANSRAVAEDVGRVCRHRAPVRVVYNAIDLNAFNAEGEALDLDALAGMPPAPPGTVRVGLVATLGWWKGHETFLTAIAKLPPGLPLRAYVVGGALYETVGSQHSLDTLRERARELGIAERVGFTGFIDDVPAAMRGLDVVVHASTEPEAFGLVIIEGMACERAVIASAAGGAAELIEGGRSALGHRPGDPADLARCISMLVVDAELRRRLGRAGRVVAEKGFDRARLAGELAPIYAEAAGG